MGAGYGLLQEVRAYWEGLRTGPALPQRASIDPRGLERALAHVFLVERIAPGLARFRIAGMHLTVLMGMEVRGMPISALFEPAARDPLQDALEGLFDGPAIVELALDAERGLGRPALEGRMILLPVCGDGGACDRALGCLVTVGAVGRSPRRFALARRVTEPVVIPLMADHKAEPAPIAGFAEPAPAFVPNPAAPPARGHLRLVKSD